VHRRRHVSATAFFAVNEQAIAISRNSFAHRLRPCWDMNLGTTDMDFDHTRTAMLAAMPQLRSYAVSLCRDPDRANDLAQETLLRAYANIRTFKPGSNMVGWLFAILRNQYYAAYRKHHREVEDVDGTYAQTLAIEPDQIIQLEWSDMRAAVAELPDGMRRALVLVAVEGLSYDEAARVCNCPPGTVRSRVHRARARLAEIFALDARAPGYDMRASEGLGAAVVVFDAA